MPESGNPQPNYTALIELVKGQAHAMERYGDKLDDLAALVSAIHTDIEVMKSKAEQDAVLAQEVSELRKKVAALELRNAQQDGGLKMATFVKDFGPWLLACVAALVAWFKR